MLTSTRLSHWLSQCMLPVATLFLLQPRRCGSGAVSMHGYNQPSTERCVIHAPVNGSMLHLNEDMEIREEHRFARVTCLLEEDRWEQDACRMSFQAAGQRGPWMSLPWSSPYTQHSVQVNGTVWTRFPMWFELADKVPGYMTYGVSVECDGSEQASATVAVVIHQPEIESLDECVPRISLPADQRTRWLPSLHYLSAVSNRLIKDYKIDVRIEVEGCGPASKFQALYFETSIAGKHNTPLGVSHDARDTVSLVLPGLGSHDLVVELLSTDGLNRVVSTRVITLELRRTEERKRFCYLIQGSEPMNVDHLKTSESEVIQLVWRGLGQHGEGAKNVVFYPNSSWTQGRNRLFEEMHARYPGVEFQYAVFLDDDAELEEVGDFGMNTGNAWRTFERYLMEWEPAVGIPSYQYAPKSAHETQTVFNFDQIVVAYHWETWPVLLPYTEVFDDQSWWYCATVQNVLCTAFYNSYRIQFNAVKAFNPMHRTSEGQYKTATSFQIPMGWIASALTDLETIGQLPFQYPAQPEGFGVPKKRGRDQGVDVWFINPTIDFKNLGSRHASHPASRYLLSYESQHGYFRDRALLQPFGQLLHSRHRNGPLRSPLMRHISELSRRASSMSKSFRIAILDARRGSLMKTNSTCPIREDHLAHYSVSPR